MCSFDWYMNDFRTINSYRAYWFQSSKHANREKRIQRLHTLFSYFPFFSAKTNTHISKVPSFALLMTFISPKSDKWLRHSIIKHNNHWPLPAAVNNEWPCRRSGNDLFLDGVDWRPVLRQTAAHFKGAYKVVWIDCYNFSRISIRNL